MGQSLNHVLPLPISCSFFAALVNSMLQFADPVADPSTLLLGLAHLVATQPLLKKLPEKALAVRRASFLSLFSATYQPSVACRFVGMLAMELSNTLQTGVHQLMSCDLSASLTCAWSLLCRRCSACQA